MSEWVQGRRLTPHTYSTYEDPPTRFRYSGKRLYFPDLHSLHPMILFVMDGVLCRKARKLVWRVYIMHGNGQDVMTTHQILTGLRKSFFESPMSNMIYRSVPVQPNGLTSLIDCRRHAVDYQSHIIEVDYIH
jgi:hypothetical protein